MHRMSDALCGQFVKLKCSMYAAWCDAVNILQSNSDTCHSQSRLLILSLGEHFGLGNEPVE